MRERSVGSSSAIRVSQIRQCYKQCTWRHDRKPGRRVDSASRQQQWTCTAWFRRRTGDTRTNGVAPLLKITRDDINDEVKRRKKKKKKEAECARAAALSSSGDAATNSVASVGIRVRFAPDTASSRLNDEETHGARLLVHRRIAPLHALPRQRATLPFHQA